jgi:hypothetical protein
MFALNKLQMPLLFMFILMLTSCGKQDSHIPTLVFKTDAQFASDGAIVAYNSPVNIGLVADGGGANITMIRVDVESETGIRTMLDSGANIAVLDWSRAFPKGDGWNETWTITVMNRDRQTATASLHINKDSASTYGLIYSWPSVILGMQGNTSQRNFFDPMNGLSYFPAEVTAVLEPTVDVAFYYDAADSYTAFSSGCSLSELYYPCFTAWGTRNYTAWDIHTAVTAAAFDQATNDSLLVASYDEVYGKKKYKFLPVGGVIPFKTAAGKKGLLKVIAQSGNEAGTIECAIKIQQ